MILILLLFLLFLLYNTALVRLTLIFEIACQNNSYIFITYLDISKYVTVVYTALKHLLGNSKTFIMICGSSTYISNSCLFKAKLKELFYSWNVSSLQRLAIASQSRNFKYIKPSGNHQSTMITDSAQCNKSKHWFQKYFPAERETFKAPRERERWLFGFSY